MSLVCEKVCEYQNTCGHLYNYRTAAKLLYSMVHSRCFLRDLCVQVCVTVYAGYVRVENFWGVYGAIISTDSLILTYWQTD